ncbi:hypothetical protein FSOLCH5_004429 [Fusarium solani]|nr:hypothetical protein NW759_002795 [Fusarium solani]
MGGLELAENAFQMHAGNDDMRTWARSVADPSSWSPFPSHADPDPGIPITTRGRSEGDSWLYSVPTSSGLILTGLRPPWHHVGCVRRLRSREARIMQPRPG